MPPLIWYFINRSMTHKLKCTTPLKSFLISNYQHLTQLYHQTYQMRKNTMSHDKQLLTYTTVASTSNHMVSLTKWAKGTTAWAGSIISITTVVSSKLIQLKIYNLTVLYLIDITTVCSTSQTKKYGSLIETQKSQLALTRLKNLPKHRRHQNLTLSGDTKIIIVTFILKQ